MSEPRASVKALRSNIAWFALGYVLLAAGHYVMLDRGWISDDVLLSTASVIAVYCVAVAVAGYAYARTQRVWSGAERHAQSLRYAAISLVIDLVPASALMPPVDLSIVMRGLHYEPVSTVMIVVVSLFVFALVSLILLAIRDGIARLVLYGVSNFLRRQTSRPHDVGENA